MISNDRGSAAQNRGYSQEALAQYKLALTIAEGSNARLKVDYLGDSLSACLGGVITGVQCH
jgi:hypothetical protein